jgi:serine protease Do
MKSFLGRFRYNRLASTFTLLAMISAGILIGSIATSSVRGQETQVNSSDATPLKIPPPRDLATQFTKIAKEVGPAVVNINTEILPKQQKSHHRGLHGLNQQAPNGGGDNGGGDDNNGGDNNGFQDFFNRFFGMNPGMGPQQDQERESLGSGFIVDPHGYIITNDHVVDKADRIFVRLASDPENSQGRPAVVVGVDKATDIAVIKIQTDKPLPTVKMGNSDGVQVGDQVLAIGEPFGLSATVTEGIISSKNRTVQQGTAGEFQHFLQTDAAINPGNSGGPLVDMAGEVIGVNTAIFTQSAGNEGIGFAMPSNTVIDVYNQLIGPDHKVVRGSIGISFLPNPSEAVARIYGFQNGGVIVSSVPPGLPAAKAGIKPGDVITTIDGKPVKDGDDLVAMISAHKPGAVLDLGLLRNGQEMHLKVTVGSRQQILDAMSSASGSQNQGPASQTPAQVTPGTLGITVSNLPPGAPSGVHGVMIQNVKPGSFADQIHISDLQGWVIEAVNRHPVNNIQDYEKAVTGLHSGDDVALQIVNPQNPSSGIEYLGGTLP